MADNTLNGIKTISFVRKPARPALKAIDIDLVEHPSGVKVSELIVIIRKAAENSEGPKVGLLGLGVILVDNRTFENENLITRLERRADVVFEVESLLLMKGVKAQLARNSIIGNKQAFEVISHPSRDIVVLDTLVVGRPSI